MIAFVTKSDLDNYKHVADSVSNDDKWYNYVSEAQLFDVKVWLGDALLNQIATQISASPTDVSEANQKLLDGGTYIYNSKTYMFQGLKAAIIYYAFARFTSRTPYNHTAAGVVVKASDFSEPVSDKVLQRLTTEAQLMAEAIRDEVVKFLNRNYTDYPLWDKNCGMPQRRVTFTPMGD